ALRLSCAFQQVSFFRPGSLRPLFYTDRWRCSRPANPVRQPLNFLVVVLVLVVVQVLFLNRKGNAARRRVKRVLPCPSSCTPRPWFKWTPSVCWWTSCKTRTSSSSPECASAGGTAGVSARNSREG
ncbi:unnamed protein product, partial [Scytosiphon promiscuus]